MIMVALISQLDYRDVVNSSSEVNGTSGSACSLGVSKHNGDGE